ncbi:MAG: phosphoribosylanthranilate isomerase [Rubrobacter sp.]|jgi:phosphoribosylanthranilate isomerase|nr:phosphoribosylanthranilate isomerase [Rubrobacter sp.]
MIFTKVCGMTRPEDAEIAAESGADAIGLIFAESPRKVGVESAREISASLPGSVRKVGVFVNERTERVREVASLVGLDIIQLHGDEGPDDVLLLRDLGFTVIKAMRVKDEHSLREMELFEPDFFLLDAWSKEVYGGTGGRFDWDVAKALRGRANIVVSGGLDPENVREAIGFFEPFGVDASSSLEERPGIKNGELVRRFIRAAKS